MVLIQFFQQLHQQVVVVVGAGSSQGLYQWSRFPGGSGGGARGNMSRSKSGGVGNTPPVSPPQGNDGGVTGLRYWSTGQQWWRWSRCRWNCSSNPGKSSSQRIMVEHGVATSISGSSVTRAGGGGGGWTLVLRRSSGSGGGGTGSPSGGDQWH